MDLKTAEEINSSTRQNLKDATTSRQFLMVEYINCTDAAWNVAKGGISESRALGIAGEEAVGIAAKKVFQAPISYYPNDAADNSRPFLETIRRWI